LEVAKVNGKTPNFHKFLGISREISPFSQVFAVFMPGRCDFGRFFTGISARIYRRKTTTLRREARGFERRSEGPILCGMMDA
jgi:hypothetical protein